MNNPLGKRAADIFFRIRKQKPLIHHITNFVVMNDTANLTLHAGALPVMAHAREEVKEMTRVSGALILNPGTLDKEQVEAMNLAGREANVRRVPIILDPVGAGATRFRTKTNLDFLRKLKIAILRGNSGEIGALSGAGGAVKGVESVEGIADPERVARALARAYKTVVVITGKRDIITDGRALYRTDNGHALLAAITGSGCMATTMVGIFAAVEKDYALAAAAALAVYGVAAERAAIGARGPASFKVALLDAVYNLTRAQIINGVRITKK